jgi:hypothetical protein
MLRGFGCCNGVLGCRRGQSRNARDIHAPLVDVAEVMLSAVVNQLHHTAAIGELEPQFRHAELRGDPPMHPQLILEHRRRRLNRDLDRAIEERRRMNIPRSRSMDTAVTPAVLAAARRWWIGKPPSYQFIALTNECPVLCAMLFRILYFGIFGCSLTSWRSAANAPDRNEIAR